MDIPTPIHDWLARAIELGASDLHVIPGYPPVLRVHGDLTELREPSLDAGTTANIFTALCPPEPRARLDSQRHVDFSFDAAINTEVRRFRANVFVVGGALGACVRIIPASIPDF